MLLFFAVPPPAWLLAVGAGLILAGVALHGWAAGYLARAGYEERESVLTVRGPYRHNRNPYYLAHLVMDLGFFCVAGQPWFYLVYFPVIFGVYRWSVKTEEAFLIEEFGDDYRDFRREVPRWGWRLRPATARGYEQQWEWSMFRRNGEVGRAAPHLVLLAVFAAIWYFGNPFDALSTRARASILGVYATAVVLRDVYPLQPSRPNARWGLVAAGVVATAVVALRRDWMWTPWPAPWAWAMLAAGLSIGLVVAFTTLPGFSRRTGKHLLSIYPQPVTPWWWILFGLGLMSGSWAGLWLAVLTVLAVWTLSMAGLMRIRRPTPRLVSAVALLVLFVGWAGVSAWRLAG